MKPDNDNLIMVLAGLPRPELMWLLTLKHKFDEKHPTSKIFTSLWASAIQRWKAVLFISSTLRALVLSNLSWGVAITETELYELALGLETKENEIQNQGMLEIQIY